MELVESEKGVISHILQFSAFTIHHKLYHPQRTGSVQPSDTDAMGGIIHVHFVDSIVERDY